MLATAPEGPFDFWIQAASGGESMLANAIFDALQQEEKGRKLNILASSNTSQGVEILTKTAERATENLQLSISYFPFDIPPLMDHAFTRFQPRLAVLVETELWPGFLIAAHNAKVPVLLINGRMSAKSHRTYRRFATFFQRFGPEKVLAMSKEDAARFVDLVGPKRVQILPNLKFDKLSTSAAAKNFDRELFAENTPFLVFGSIRKQEEKQIICVIHQLLQQHPKLITGFFPKHVERAEKVIRQLNAIGLPCRLRSTLDTAPATPGTVIVWDRFGELAAAYQLAKAAFVGGSLCGWGGHNFLEPLIAGVRPVTGPNWQNFAWIGREIVECGLVKEVHSSQELVQALHNRLARSEDRTEIMAQVERYLATRRGGTQATCATITQYIDKSKS